MYGNGVDDYVTVTLLLVPFLCKAIHDNVQVITHMLQDPDTESLDTNHHLSLQELTESSNCPLLGLSFLFFCLLLRFQYLLPLVQCFPNPGTLAGTTVLLGSVRARLDLGLFRYTRSTRFSR